MNILKCRTLGACITECACAYLWRGKWPTRVQPYNAGLWLCNEAVSEEIPQNFTPLLFVMYVVSFVEGINLLQASLSTDK